MPTKKRLTISLLAIFLSAALFSSANAQDAAQRTYKSSAEKKQGQLDWLVKHPTIEKLVSLANAERVRYGLPPVTIDPKMCLEAQKHAVWMAKTGYYMHSSLPWQEIIFQGPRTPEAAIQGWIYSPAHHGIMLSGSKAGFGYMIISGRTYWVGVFQ